MDELVENGEIEIVKNRLKELNNPFGEEFEKKLLTTGKRSIKGILFWILLDEKTFAPIKKRFLNSPPNQDTQPTNKPFSLANCNELL